MRKIPFTFQESFYFLFSSNFLTPSSKPKGVSTSPPAAGVSRSGRGGRGEDSSPDEGLLQFLLLFSGRSRSEMQDIADATQDELSVLATILKGALGP